MKKILMTFIALTMLAAFTACSSNTENAENMTETSVFETTKKTEAETKQETKSETKPESENEEETKAKTEAETKPESEIEKETQAETEAETVMEMEKEDNDLATLTGTGYTLKYNSEEWLDTLTLKDAALDLADSEMNMSESDLELVNVDIMYAYKDSLSNFNVVMQPMEENIISAEYVVFYDTLMKDTYNNTEYFKYNGSKLAEFNGYDAIRLELDATYETVTMSMVQYIFWNNKTQYTITYTENAALENSRLSDFEEMLNTIEFT